MRKDHLLVTPLLPLTPYFLSTKEINFLAPWDISKSFLLSDPFRYLQTLSCLPQIGFITIIYWQPFQNLWLEKKKKPNTTSIDKTLGECMTQGWDLKLNFWGYVKKDLNRMREWAMEILQREYQAEGPITVKDKREPVCLLQKTQWSFSRSPPEAIHLWHGKEAQCLVQWKGS